MIFYVSHAWRTISSIRGNAYNLGGGSNLPTGSCSGLELSGEFLEMETKMMNTTNPSSRLIILVGKGFL